VSVWRTSLLLGALALVAADAHGQELPLKTVVVSAPAPGECPAQPPAPALRGGHAGVDSLLNAGSRAAILGDFPAAEDFLRRAAALDGANPVVSYRLARTLDDQGKSEPAAAEYCRYLSLAPDTPDAAEIRERVRTLAGSGSVALADPWTREMSAATEAYRAGRFADAVGGFTRAIEIAPAAADGYYDRAVSYLAMDRGDAAAEDLEAYLRLAPQADDATRVRVRMDQLRAPAVSAAAPAAASPRRTTAAPTLVLVEGMVLPGLGQHETGRTMLGVGVLSAVGGAVLLALHEQDATRERQAQDPFGNPYTYQVRVRERPFRTLGFGAAVAIGLGAAVEGFLYARRQPAELAEAEQGSGRALPELALERSGEAVRIGLRFSARSR
jgi:tetratricopeptide (TPR) repeat protein